MSASKGGNVLKLVNEKQTSDGTVLQKVERYSDQGVELSFIRDGERVASVIKRLNILTDQQNWLSLKPVSAGRFSHLDVDTKTFGELNQHNKLHGRGIKIWPDGDIIIQYWNNGATAPGNYISI